MTTQQPEGEVMNEQQIVARIEFLTGELPKYPNSKQQARDEMEIEMLKKFLPLAQQTAALVDALILAKGSIKNYVAQEAINAGATPEQAYKIAAECHEAVVIDALIAKHRKG